VKIEIRCAYAPIAIGLSSCQRLNWQLNIAPGIELAGIYLAGSNLSTISGVSPSLVNYYGTSCGLNFTDPSMIEFIDDIQIELGEIQWKSLINCEDARYITLNHECFPGVATECIDE
jgi:hypothetical protein